MSELFAVYSGLGICFRFIAKDWCAGGEVPGGLPIKLPTLEYYSKVTYSIFELKR